MTHAVLPTGRRAAVLNPDDHPARIGIAQLPCTPLTPLDTAAAAAPSVSTAGEP